MYLGDLISSGTIRNTIEDGKCKGFGIVKEIMAILDDVPLGRYKMAIGNPYGLKPVVFTDVSPCIEYSFD